MNSVSREIVIVKIILSIILLLCLLDMPYGYYQIVRLFGLIGFGFLAYKEYLHSKWSQYFYIWVISAILFNPVIKISLGRFLWNIIDVVLAITLIVSIRLKAKAR